MKPYRTVVNDDERFLSVSAMPEYDGKSHEELRLEDYLLGDKGMLGSCNF